MSHKVQYNLLIILITLIDTANVTTTGTATGQVTGTGAGTGTGTGRGGSGTVGSINLAVAAIEEPSREANDQ